MAVMMECGEHRVQATPLALFTCTCSQTMGRPLYCEGRMNSSILLYSVARDTDCLKEWTVQCCLMLAQAGEGSRQERLRWGAP